MYIPLDGDGYFRTYFAVCAQRRLERSQYPTGRRGSTVTQSPHVTYTNVLFA